MADRYINVEVRLDFAQLIKGLEDAAEALRQVNDRLQELIFQETDHA